MIAADGLPSRISAFRQFQTRMCIVWNPLSVNALGAMSSERTGLRTARRAIRPISQHPIPTLAYGSIHEPSFANDEGQTVGQTVKAQSFLLQYSDQALFNSTIILTRLYRNV